MKNPIHKETYNGQGIYWHGRNYYGDETNIVGNSIAEVRAWIDRKLAKEKEDRPEHLKHWDTLNHDERNRWRRLSQTTELSAPELAYTNR